MVDLSDVLREISRECLCGVVAILIILVALLIMDLLMEERR